MYSHKFNDICSAELYEKRYFVPCEPAKCLDFQYGKNKWVTPEAKNFKLNSLFFDKIWSEHELLYALRVYDSNGSLLKNKQNYKKLPKDDEDLI